LYPSVLQFLMHLQEDGWIVGCYVTIERGLYLCFDDTTRAVNTMDQYWGALAPLISGPIKIRKLAFDTGDYISIGFIGQSKSGEDTWIGRAGIAKDSSFFQKLTAVGMITEKDKPSCIIS
jgi:hypothetical protein